MLVRAVRNAKEVANKFIVVTTRHHAMQSKYHRKHCEIILVKRVFSSVTILATCRLIRDEAAPILAPKLRSISSQPMQYIIDLDCSILFTSHRDGVLALIIETTLEINSLNFSQTYISNWGHGWLIDSINFASKCIAWQHKKSFTERGVWADTEIVLRLAPHHQELEKETDSEYETGNLGYAVRSVLTDMRTLDDIYFGAMLIERPRLLAKLDGQDEEWWNKCFNEHTDPEEFREYRSLPIMDDETWKKEWEEGEVL